MLYAGTTSLLSFKYLILKYKVKKLKLWSKSAGNIFNAENGTSETLRNEIVLNTFSTQESCFYFLVKQKKTGVVRKLGENIKHISVHVSKHLKPVSDDQFGHYLAGLIDGVGYFSSKQQLVIVFHSLDASLAYYIKERLGYGRVKKVKAKNALVITAKIGLEKVIKLINGKIRTENVFNQITNNILNHNNYTEISKSISLNLNLSNDFNNHWLAGFSDAYGSFQINIVNLGGKWTEVGLNFQIARACVFLWPPMQQKQDSVWLLIKEYLGGNIGYRKSQDTYYYESSCIDSVKNVINYLDSFHLLSSKYINYLKWRKAYIIIQNKDHLNKNGFEKIIKLKKTMSKLSDITI